MSSSPGCHLAVAHTIGLVVGFVSYVGESVGDSEVRDVEVVGLELPGALLGFDVGGWVGSRVATADSQTSTVGQSLPKNADAQHASTESCMYVSLPGGVDQLGG